MRKNASVTVSRVLSRVDHLSRPGVAAQVQAMPRTRRAAACVLLRILHQMGFTARTSRQAVGELLPRLSILTAPLAECGGISLLHSPWSRLHRPLAGILPYGARTFLIPLLARDRLITSHGCYHSAKGGICQGWGNPCAKHRLPKAEKICLQNCAGCGIMPKNSTYFGGFSHGDAAADGDLSGVY